MMKATLIISPLLAAGYASAHGFVWKLGVNTQTYTGNVPGATGTPSVIQAISTQDPVKGANNPSLTCGQNATAGSLVADVNPGDSVTFDWRDADLSNWFHNTGPMLTYMASCGSTTCDQFDSTQAKWFKIQQQGMKDASSWYLADLVAGGVANSSIPNNLAPGNYLIRHEIIALQIAVSVGGAEFYPSCSQLRVGGAQTGAPSASDLVSLPGAYSDTDPGILTPDVFNPGFTYVFPGPPIASFISGDAATNSGTTSGNSTSSTSSTTPTMATPSSSMPSNSMPLPSASTTPSNSCRLMKRSVSQRSL